jgi:hypothetical protein
MTVYVDDMNQRYGRMIMCHMIADTEEELHQMADRIGVSRRWYQGDHYDISLGMKAKAFRCGAKPITWRECSLMTVLRRRDPKAKLLTPEQGREWVQRYVATEPKK